ncbi:MAG: DUF58 domain-containing protein [Planctomycetes bacterium]|nr:DUF58 domain-containing protein [Planctomycetota bacterium]
MRSSVLPPRNAGSGVPVVALGVLALAAAVQHRSPGCAALGLALLLVPLAVYVLLRRSLRGVTLERIAPEKASEGDTIEVEVRVRNGSRMSLFHPRASEVYVPEVHAPKHVLFPCRVEPGETVTESYEGTCLLPRGVYSLGPVTISFSDPFGWFQVERTFPCPARIKVYPWFQELRAAERSGDCLSAALADLTRSVAGDSTEFLSVREYRIGDPLRRVHWGLTAHRGFPVVREYARSARGDLFLFLDPYRYAFLGVGKGSSLELSVKIAASLAAHAARRRHRVRLHAGRWAGGGPSDAAGAPLTAILDALVEVRPDGERPIEDVLDQEARQVPPGATAVLMVSPYVRPSRRFEGHLGALRARGVRVVLVVFDDATFPSLYETRRAGSELEEYLARARARGLEAVRVRCGASPRTVFAAPVRRLA